ncbi:MAG TPA: 2-hydroxychromene-2-carboxylate isomerase [Kofleriaceae bacterium]|nr:2-hydroxychromene-2-carboxylate isomerase [Kofleriaceae bacterium]
MQIELYFDFSCPFAYLASRDIEALAARAGATLVWRPMLLGGVLRETGAESALAGEAPAKRQHHMIDKHRWAEVRGAPLVVPDGHPIRTVRALRALLSLEPARWSPVIRALFSAYWERGERIDDEAVLRRALGGAGVTGDALERAIAANGDPAIKDELRRRTSEAIARGVFGAPTAIASGGPGGGEHLLWGQDRLEHLEAILGGWDPASGAPPASQAASGPGAPTSPPPAGSERGVIQFWYDFSSPFSYLAATQAQAVADRAGAALEWRPMLLGAVFRDSGTANVPLLAMSESKRRWVASDLKLWASWWGVPFRFASKFPQKTVTALRLALLAGDRIAELSLAMFRAMWASGQDLEDPAVLRAVVDRLGLDGEAMLARTQDPEVKQRLIDSTGEAVRRGIFGAPTFVVARGGAEMLFWGQDRLGLVERAAAGHPAPSR